LVLQSINRKAKHEKADGPTRTYNAACKGLRYLVNLALLFLKILSDVSVNNMKTVSPVWDIILQGNVTDL